MLKVASSNPGPDKSFFNKQIQIKLLLSFQAKDMKLALPGWRYDSQSIVIQQSDIQEKSIQQNDIRKNGTEQSDMRQNTT